MLLVILHIIEFWSECWRLASVQVMSGYPPDYETGYAKLKGQYVALRPLVDYYTGR